MSCDLRPRIVIVNDDQHFLQMAAGVLQDAGYEVTTCDQPRNCYSVIRDVRPDLAIVDAKMRDVDDWHVLTLVLLDRDLRSMPVLVSCPLGPDAELLERRMLELGCRLITKPFTAEELLDAVRATIQTRGAA